MVKIRATFGLLQLAVLGAFLAGLLFGASQSALAQSSSEQKTSSVSIRTPDFDETIRWYQDKLGFRLIATENFVPGRTAVMERSGALIEITEADHILPSLQEPDATGGVEVMPVPVLSLLVQDVDAEVKRLSQEGVDILQDPQDDINGAYRTAQIRDNGRHRIELREPVSERGSFNPSGR